MVDTFLGLNNLSWQRRPFALANDAREVWARNALLLKIGRFKQPQKLYWKENSRYLKLYQNLGNLTGVELLMCQSSEKDEKGFTSESCYKGKEIYKSVMHGSRWYFTYLNILLFVPQSWSIKLSVLLKNGNRWIVSLSFFRSFALTKSLLHWLRRV